MRPRPELEKFNDFWQRALSGAEHIGLTKTVVMAYIQISKSRQAYRSPNSADEAVKTVRVWLESSHVHIVEAGIEHLHFLQRVLASVGGLGTLVSDAYLATVALQHGGTIHSKNSELGKFDRIE